MIETWYSRRGLPEPTNDPDTIIARRIAKEKQKEEDRINAFLGKLKFGVSINEGAPEDFDNVTPQCVTGFGDIKINFKKGE